MSLPTLEPISDEDSALPPARRRQRRRMIVPPDSSERAEFLHELSRRVVPSFDFFLFSLLSGLVLGGAFLLDSPALVVLAALLAPFMAPMLGISLGSITGAARFVLQSAVSLAIGSLIVFLCGMMAGLALNLLPSLLPSLPEVPYRMAIEHSRFSWPGFLVISLGAGFSALLLARAAHQRPLVTSVAIAYGLYLPVGAAGFGLSSGLPGLWPGGLAVFLAHLLWAALIGALALGLVGLRPLNAAGYLLGAVYAVAGVVALVFLAGNAPQMPPIDIPPSSVSSVGGLTPITQERTAILVEDITVTPTATRVLSPTPVPPTPTATRTRTLVPSPTATLTVTPMPTPVWAYVAAVGFDGAILRTEASFDSPVVQSLLNGTLVEVLPDVVVNGNVTWVHIRTVAGKEGWIVRTLLRTATPAPGW